MIKNKYNINGKMQAISKKDDNITLRPKFYSKILYWMWHIAHFELEITGLCIQSQISDTSMLLFSGNYVKVVLINLNINFENVYVSSNVYNEIKNVQLEL